MGPQPSARLELAPFGYRPNALDWGTVLTYDWKMYVYEQLVLLNIKIKGGDPAAGSPTATLWQLNPPHWTQVWIIQKNNPHLDPARLVWWAVCARLRDMFTGLYWDPITRNSNVMRASYSPQFGLGRSLEVWLLLSELHPIVSAIVARV